MQIDLGRLGKKKNPFDHFTKSALVAMLEDAVSKERERSLPMHKRGEKGEPEEKDEATEEADEEREKLADLAEESHGTPAPVEMDDEDMSEEAMDGLKKKIAGKTKKAK